ncbi:MAG: GNAT family N-acetyltransferase [Candidatus Omnitrophica bacterium]|nr:GNAT family N-acetyltransferase [Candidatus Omnitrophota bacterium]
METVKIETAELWCAKYMQVAESTGVFKPQELAVLRELAIEYHRMPDVNYFVFEEYNEAGLAGFAIFGRTPLTLDTWDLYWLVVHRDCQGKGIGKNLIRRIEHFIALSHARALLRVETSGRKEYAHARNLYVKMGFTQACSIPNFYDAGDDLMIYYKELYGGMHE